MPAVDDRSLVGEGPSKPSSARQNATLHSVPSSSSDMPMHIYPYPATGLPLTQQPVKSKRRQVKNACTNCQKSCKKCDDARPCLRCVKYGIAEECVDSQRKERQKGVKRGPYRKREGKDRASRSAEHSDVPPPVSNAVSPQTGGSYTHTPLGYPPGFYGQYSPAPLVSRPGDSLHTYPTPPWFLATVPGQPQMGTSEDAYQTQEAYLTPVFLPVPYHHPQKFSGAGQGEIGYGGGARVPDMRSETESQARPIP